MTNLNSDSIGAVRDQAAQLLQSVIEQATTRAMEQARATKEKSGRISRMTGNKSKSRSSNLASARANSGKRLPRARMRVFSKAE